MNLGGLHDASLWKKICASKPGQLLKLTAPIDPLEGRQPIFQHAHMHRVCYLTQGTGERCHLPAIMDLLPIDNLDFAGFSISLGDTFQTLPKFFASSVILHSRRFHLCPETACNPITVVLLAPHPCATYSATSGNPLVLTSFRSDFSILGVLDRCNSFLRSYRSSKKHSSPRTCSLRFAFTIRAIGFRVRRTEGYVT